MALNRGLANPVFDFLMPWITEEDHWKIPILAIWLLLVVFGKKRGRIAAVCVAVALLLSDQTVNFVLKPWIHRIRPCFSLENVRLLIDQPPSPSFPSSHAANMATAAFVFSSVYRRWTALFVTIAFIVAFSRIYVGVHYPSDVAGGALIGCAMAAAVLLGKKYLLALVERIKTEKSRRDVANP